MQVMQIRRNPAYRQGGTAPRAFLILACALCLPGVAHGFNTFADFVNILIEIANLMVVVLMALTLIYILWGAVKLVYSTDDKSSAGAKQTLLWGVIVLACMVALWGIVRVIATTFFP